MPKYGWGSPEEPFADIPRRGLLWWLSVIGGYLGFVLLIVLFIILVIER